MKNLGTAVLLATLGGVLLFLAAQGVLEPRPEEDAFVGARSCSSLTQAESGAPCRFNTSASIAQTMELVGAQDFVCHLRIQPVGGTEVRTDWVGCRPDEFSNVHTAPVLLYRGGVVSVWGPDGEIHLPGNPTGPTRLTALVFGAVGTLLFAVGLAALRIR